MMEHEVRSTNEMVFSKNPTVRKSTPEGAQYRPRNVATRTVAAAADVTYTRSDAKLKSSYVVIYLLTWRKIESTPDQPVPKPMHEKVTYRPRVMGIPRTALCPPDEI